MGATTRCVPGGAPAHDFRRRADRSGGSAQAPGLHPGDDHANVFGLHNDEELDDADRDGNIRFALTKSADSIALLGLAAVLLFAYLDANYLRQEKRFRRLYVAVAAGRD